MESAPRPEIFSREALAEEASRFSSAELLRGSPLAETFSGATEGSAEWLSAAKGAARIAWLAAARGASAFEDPLSAKREVAAAAALGLEEEMRRHLAFCVAAARDSNAAGFASPRQFCHDAAMAALAAGAPDVHEALVDPFDVRLGARLAQIDAGRHAEPRPVKSEAVVAEGRGFALVEEKEHSLEEVSEWLACGHRAGNFLFRVDGESAFGGAEGAVRAIERRYPCRPGTRFEQRSPAGVFRGTVTSSNIDELAGRYGVGCLTAPLFVAERLTVKVRYEDGAEAEAFASDLQMASSEH